MSVLARVVRTSRLTMYMTRSRYDYEVMVVFDDDDDDEYDDEVHCRVLSFRNSMSIKNI